jgi:hypothetical protein
MTTTTSRTRITVVCPLNFCNWHFRAEGDTYLAADAIGKERERAHWQEYHAQPISSRKETA